MAQGVEALRLVDAFVRAPGAREHQPPFSFDDRAFLHQRSELVLEELTLGAQRRLRPLSIGLVLAGREADELSTQGDRRLSPNGSACALRLAPSDENLVRAAIALPRTARTIVEIPDALAHLEALWRQLLAHLKVQPAAARERINADAQALGWPLLDS